MFPFDSFDATTANRFVSSNTHYEGEARGKVVYEGSKVPKTFRVSVFEFFQFQTGRTVTFLILRFVRATFSNLIENRYTYNP